MPPLRSRRPSSTSRNPHSSSPFRHFRRFFPDPERLQQHRWLRWMGPILQHPRLWHVSRRGIALGVALGLFFGLLLPIAQIPMSGAVAVALRANVPAAVASTFVSNPLTFGPIYYAAWRLGSAVLGEGGPPPAPEALAAVAEPGPMVNLVPGGGGPAAAPAEVEKESWWTETRRRLLGVGKPLLLGLALMASVTSVVFYFGVSWVWALRTRLVRRRRVRAARGEGKPGGGQPPAKR
ncbi:hypothetical protein CR3_3387 [Cupriavidus gilardii CR3]|nr:DUF2062 domain-containing protein [Cupriavidus gilardii]ALD92574.1 hypothetical protein CR3_3387 [Cupriavidus gilardii CR3]MCT9014225.1 DUF2062 domain-containing protein [Cupriavidus gilardii]MCT9053945.1 DUF2062 domain-containing protein [Cupriavidus gilardii]WNG68618.1 DUF2062 domain-containing protein [Cupriavidus gilardii]